MDKRLLLAPAIGTIHGPCQSLHDEHRTSSVNIIICHSCQQKMGVFQVGDIQADNAATAK